MAPIPTSQTEALPPTLAVGGAEVTRAVGPLASFLPGPASPWPVFPTPLVVV